jgi:exopolysaccharide biosynthesis protein
MCLDGGGSATLWTMGQVMNNPCEGDVRGTGNSLIVLSKEDP